MRRNGNLGKDVRMIEIDAILLIGAVVLIAAIIAARIGALIGLPSLLLFLGLGLLMGESGIGIPFDNANLAQALGNPTASCGRGIFKSNADAGST